MKLENTIKERDKAEILSDIEGLRKDARKEIATLLNDANEKEKELYRKNPGKNDWGRRHQCGDAPGNRDKPAHIVPQNLSFERLLPQPDQDFLKLKLKF